MSRKRISESKLTVERLKELLFYRKKTGHFIRLVNAGGYKKGTIAGSIKRNNHRYVSVEGIEYLASRLANFYVKGYFPEHQIDHINRCSSDDRWKNLREATNQCNNRNKGPTKANTSGIVGVSFDSRCGKWHAQIMVNYKTIHLGFYKRKESAVVARWIAERKNNFVDCQTESTAYLYLKNRTLISIAKSEINLR